MENSSIRSNFQPRNYITMQGNSVPSTNRCTFVAAAYFLICSTASCHCALALLSAMLRKRPELNSSVNVLYDINV